MTYYISQGRAKAPIRISGQLCCRGSGCTMEGTQIVWCPSIPYPANRTPAYRHNIASQSWWPTVWTIWDYLRSLPGLCASSRGQITKKSYDNLM